MNSETELERLTQCYLDGNLVGGEVARLNELLLGERLRAGPSPKL